MLSSRWEKILDNWVAQKLSGPPKSAALISRDVIRISHTTEAVCTLTSCIFPLFLCADNSKGLTFQHSICFSEMSGCRHSAINETLYSCDYNKCRILHNHNKHTQ